MTVPDGARNVPYLVYGQHDDNTLRQFAKTLQHPSCIAGVLAADGHYGYAHPIGASVAYEGHISLSGVGYDIGCGNTAIRLSLSLADVKDRLDSIADAIADQVSFGVGRAASVKAEHPILDDVRWDHLPLARELRSTAAAQLGTVGAGNHYVDVFADEQDRIWVGVHFGSRGFGHKVATHFLKAAGATDGMDASPTILSVASGLGAEYVELMRLAGDYARAGRQVVVRTVANILDGYILDTVENHHNYAWEEVHLGRKCWVARKGATPARPGQRGFVGGSMGHDSVILRGSNTPSLLESTVHGAGRIMSRTDARGRFVKDENGKKIRQPGRVRHDEWQAWIERRNLVLRGGDIDEAPQAYRDLSDVLTAHKETIEIEHVLKPLIVVMAGKDAVDPWKD